MNARLFADTETPTESLLPASAGLTRSEREIRLKRLLFVTSTQGFGGSERHLIELIKRLPRDRVEISIVQLSSDIYTAHQKEIDHEAEIWTEEIGGSIWQWFRFFRKTRPDTVVFVRNWARSFPWYSPIAAHLAGVSKRIAIEHLIAPPFEKVQGWSLGSILRRLVGGRRRIRIAYELSGRSCTAIICVSNAVRHRLVDDYHSPADRTVTIHNGVSASAFVPCEKNRESVRASLGINPHEFTLVCVARLSPLKGIDILLLALDQVLRTGLNCRCIVVGDGPLKDSLVNQAETLGLSNRVIFEGFRKDVKPYLQAADAFVLTSYSEGFPLSILEAMACGLPCIVTDVGGNSEAVQHMVHGLVVPSGSLEEIAGAISYLVRNPQHRAEMSRMARRRVVEEFEIESRMLEIRNAILG
jgi:glycosyltransferase involved in cell wall biosynthesis